MLNAATNSLRTLRDTDLASINYLEDIRGHRVVDSQDRAVGEVDALVIDARVRKVRLLRIHPERELQADGSAIVVPVDAITRIRRGTVQIDRRRDELATAAADLSLLRREQDVKTLYGHYGITPFWTQGYSYPPYPFYT